jgi:hypothetical protein
MNLQTQQFFDSRRFRIGVIAVLAVAVLALAAYWFGTGLQADTKNSVAASPLGSSLTAVRESRSDDYYGRLVKSSAAARSASLAGSRLDDYYGRMSKPAAVDSRLDDYYGRMSRPATADSRLEDYYGRRAGPGR